MKAETWITVIGILAVILVCLFEDVKRQELLARMEVDLDKG